jgi:pimeloyl-ACP methyl ester carboxylesterase
MSSLQRMLLVIVCVIFSGCAYIENTVYNTEIAIERFRTGLKLKTIAIDDHIIFYLKGGEGETVLLVHGFTADKYTWIKFANSIADHYQVIAVDLPGHGESTFCKKCNYSISSQAQYLKQIADKLNIKQMHLVGTSMGGRISISFTHLFQDRVKSLALFNAAGVNAPIPSKFSKLLKSGVNLFDIQNRQDFDALMQISMASPPFFPWPLKSVTSKKYMTRNPINQKIFHDISESLWDCKPILRDIQKPVLVLWGKEDHIIDVSCVPIFEKNLPHSTSVILKNTGHCPMIEKPGETAEHYLTFLRNSSSKTMTSQ